MELWVNVVLEQAESSVLPPVHHLVKKLNVIFYRTKGEGDFLTNSVTNLSQHTADVNPQNFEIGEFSLGESAACFVHLVACSKERLRVKGRVFFWELPVKTKGDGDVLQERTFTDGEPERVVDLVLCESSTGGRQRNSPFPDGVNEMEVRLGKRARFDDQRSVFFPTTHGVVLDVEVLDDFGLVLDESE